MHVIRNNVFFKFLVFAFFIYFLFESRLMLSFSPRKGKVAPDVLKEESGDAGSVTSSSTAASSVLSRRTNKSQPLSTASFRWRHDEADSVGGTESDDDDSLSAGSGLDADGRTKKDREGSLKSAFLRSSLSIFVQSFVFLLLAILLDWGYGNSPRMERAKTGVKIYKLVYMKAWAGFAGALLGGLAWFRRWALSTTVLRIYTLLRTLDFIVCAWCLSALFLDYGFVAIESRKAGPVREKIMYYVTAATLIYSCIATPCHLFSIHEARNDHDLPFPFRRRKNRFQRLPTNEHEAIVNAQTGVEMVPSAQVPALDLSRLSREAAVSHASQLYHSQASAREKMHHSQVPATHPYSHPSQQSLAAEAHTPQRPAYALSPMIYAAQAAQHPPAAPPTESVYAPSAARGQHRAQRLDVDMYAKISPEEYKARWMSMRTDDVFSFAASSMPAPSHIHNSLAQRGFHLMATGQMPEVASSKYFYYAQGMNGMAFLVELVVCLDPPRVAATCKSQDRTMCGAFSDKMELRALFGM